MNNERIDLKQFEGISKGKWEHDGGEIHAEKAERNNTIIAQYPSWNYNVKDNDGILTVEDASNLIAMAAVPDLLAELKRCYEELDRPKVTIDDWDKEGPCVTVYLEGKEYVGILREYDASE